MILKNNQTNQPVFLLAYDLPRCRNACELALFLEADNLSASPDAEGSVHATTFRGACFGATVFRLDLVLIGTRSILV